MVKVLWLCSVFGHLFITVTKIPYRSNVEEEKFVSELQFQRFSPWPVISIVWGLRWDRMSWWKSVAEQSCVAHGSQKRERIWGVRRKILSPKAHPHWHTSSSHAPPSYGYHPAVHSDINPSSGLTHWRGHSPGIPVFSQVNIATCELFMGDFQIQIVTGSTWFAN